MFKVRTSSPRFALTSRVRIAASIFVWVAVQFAALAAADTPAEGNARVEVRLIHATLADTPQVHPRLKDLQTYFKRFPGYNQFTLLKSAASEIDVGKTVTLETPNGKPLVVRYRGFSKGFVKLRFKLADMEMNVRVHDGGVFFHAGYAHEGGRMIVAVRVKQE